MYLLDATHVLTNMRLHQLPHYYPTALLLEPLLLPSPPPPPQRQPLLKQNH